MTEVNVERMRAWVKALRSGDYKQGAGLLKATLAHSWQHCCLGVACEVAKQQGEGKWIPRAVPNVRGDKGFLFEHKATLKLATGDEVLDHTKGTSSAVDLPHATLAWFGLPDQEVSTAAMRAVLPEEVLQKVMALMDCDNERFDVSSRWLLADLNDTSMVSFAHIADMLEYEYPEIQVPSNEG